MFEYSLVTHQKLNGLPCALAQGQNIKKRGFSPDGNAFGAKASLM